MDTGVAESQRFDPYAHGFTSGYSDIFTPFMGPMTKPQQTSPYEKKSSSSYDLPEARVGESIFLRDTVEDWMLTANQTWYTERIMPWYRTDQIHLEWTEWENNAHFMSITPHRSMSTLVTSKRTMRKADMLRRGIAMEFENDFVKTGLGRSRFVASLAQISRSVQETANVEILRALLNSQRYTQHYLRKHKVITDGELDAYLDRLDDRFMIAQKERFGLEILNTAVDKDQEKTQGKANVWILGREVMDYCDTVRPEKTLHYLGGDEAVDRINGRLAGRQASGGTMGNVDSIGPQKMISDSEVFLAKSYVIDSVGGADLLSHTVEKGVFNVMSDRTRNYKEYRTASRHILVYDNHTDDWAEISLKEANAKCVLWDTAGDVYDPFSNGNLRGRQMATDSSIEGQNDFLRYGGWESDDFATKQDVKYVGDYDKQWMSIGQCLAAGQTVLNALERMGQGVNQANIVALLGKDNLFSKAGVNFDKDTYKVKFTQGATLADVSSNIAGAEQKHAHFLGTTLGAVVPETHKERLQDIVGKTNISWENRAEQVRDLMYEAYAEDPSSMADKFDDEDRLKAWYQNRFNAYGTGFAQWARKQQQASPVESTIRDIPIGEPLPEGASYLNDNERAKAQSGKPKLYPTSLHDFNIPEVYESAPSNGGMSRRRGIGAAARIGATFTGRGSNGEKETPEQTTQRLSQRFNNLEQRIKAIANSSASPNAKLAAQLYLGTRFNREVFDNFCDADIYVPAGFLLLRPHATYRTRYGIKCADNGNTGYCFFGNSNMEIAHEAARKVGLMHYTAYLTAVVMYPKNVYVVPDLFCEKYLGGMCTRFWTRDTYMSKGARRTKASIICTMLPPTFGERQGRLDKRIDIRGQFYTHYDMKLADEERFSRVCYPGASRTAATLQWWDPVRKSKAIDHASRFHNVDVNFICSQGVQFHFNTKTDSWGDVITEKGAFGPNVGPGSGMVRDGKAKYQEKPGYLSNGKLG